MLFYDALECGETQPTAIFIILFKLRQHDDQAGFTMLMMAANRGHIKVVFSALLYYKNTPACPLLSLTDAYNHNALDHAIRAGQQEVVDMLMAAGSPLGVYPARVSKEVLDKRKALLAKGDARGFEGGGDEDNDDTMDESDRAAERIARMAEHMAKHERGHVSVSTSEEEGIQL